MIKPLLFQNLKKISTLRTDNYCQRNQERFTNLHAYKDPFTYIGHKRLLQHPTHRLDFNKPTILGSANDTVWRLILKLLFIQEQTLVLHNDSQYIL